MLVLLAIVLALTLRQPDKVLYPQFWAEDASIFYVDAERVGVGSLVRPYNGYWHLFSRVVALVGTLVPILYLPRLYAAAALLATTVALAIAIRAGLVHRWPTRVAVVLIVVLAPLSGELWLTVTNSQWFGALLLVAMITAPPPASAQARVAHGAASLVAGLSGPFAMLLWPCAALRAKWYEDGWSAWLLGLFTACTVLTLVALLQDPRSGGLGHLPERFASLWYTARSNKLVGLGAVGGFFFMVLGLVRGLTGRDWPLVACSGAGLTITVATIVTIPSGHLSSRYLFLPWILGSWTALALGERGFRLAWVQIAVVLVVSLRNFVLPPMQHYDWPKDARCLEAHRACDMRINPGWAVGLPGRGALDPPPVP